MKIVLQTKSLAKFANPRSDMPKGTPDLIGKISMDQGFLSFYRGQSPLILLLGSSQVFKFIFYDKLLEYNSNQTVCSCATAVILTTLLYPLDLAHTLMSADMTKK